MSAVESKAMISKYERVTVEQGREVKAPDCCRAHSPRSDSRWFLYPERILLQLLLRRFTVFQEESYPLMGNMEASLCILFLANEPKLYFLLFIEQIGRAHV